MVLSTFCGIGLSLSTLLGVHGPESALVLGLVMPPFAAVTGASLVLEARSSRDAVSARRLLGEGIASALLCWAPAVIILALNQLRVRQCSPLEGLAFEVLGPGMGIWMSVLAGTLVAASVTRFARTLAALVPLIWLGLGLYEFWSTPAIFVFGHFGGWFPGTLYDEDIRVNAALISFRITTLLWIAGLSLLLASSWSPSAARVSKPRLGRLMAAAATIAIALWLQAMGPELGHRTRHEAIVEALGSTEIGTRCDVHAPREMNPEMRRRLANDCDFRVTRAERILGVTQSERVHAFFYRSAEEKRRWMGAGRTYIAKPWRAEVHLQLRDWPHSVLAHEIVHVVAGNAADGPFRVSGDAGGWFPNPGWIEGIAVAIEWPARDALDPHQYVKALRELDRLPPLSAVMSTRFLTLPPRISYTAAGSFVRYLLDTHGADVVRRIHRKADASELGRLEALEAEWLEHIDAQELYDGALELAELRFHRGSIFQRTCPHRVAELRNDLSADIAAGDDNRALSTCDEILSIEPAELGALITRVGALARQEDMEEAREALQALQAAPPPLRDRASEQLADALWLNREPDQADQIYAALLDGPQTESEARQREVKRLALQAGGRQAEIVRSLLIGRGGAPETQPVVVHLARELDRIRGDGLGSYLEARQLLAEYRFELAMPKILVARERGLPTERLRREAARMEARARFAVGELDASARIWSELQQDSFARHEAADWLERIEWVRSES